MDTQSSTMALFCRDLGEPGLLGGTGSWGSIQSKCALDIVCQYASQEGTGPYELNDLIFVT